MAEHGDIGALRDRPALISEGVQSQAERENSTQDQPE
jgi:hypothetical protein